MSPANPSAAGAATSEQKSADVQQLFGLLGSLMPLLVRFQSPPFAFGGNLSGNLGGIPSLSQPALEHQAAVNLVGDMTALTLRNLATYIQTNVSKYASLESCVPVVTQAEQSLAARDFAQAFDLMWQAYRMIAFIRATDQQIPPLRAGDGAGYSEFGRSSSASH
jgi:hypothetical protein